MHCEHQAGQEKKKAMELIQSRKEWGEGEAHQRMAAAEVAEGEEEHLQAEVVVRL